VGEVSKPIKTNPEKHAAQPAAKAAKTEESSDRDRSNSDEEPAPTEADQAERQSAKQPPTYNLSTTARKVYNVLAPEIQHTTKQYELNRKNQSQEEIIETEEDATEDNAKEEQSNTTGKGWGAKINVLKDSVINNDTLKDSTPSDYTRDLKADPTEDPTNPMDDAPEEVATMDNISRNASESPNNVNASKNSDDGKVTKNHAEEEDVKTEETADKPSEDGTATNKPTEAVTEILDEGEDAKTDEPPDNTIEEGEVDKTNEVEEATEKTAELKDNKSEEPANKSPNDDESASENRNDGGKATENPAEWKDHKSEEPANKSPEDDENASEFQNEMGVHKTEEIADNTPAAGDVNEEPEEGRVDKTTDGGKATKNHDAVGENKKNT
jgi:hypothetical protein